MRDRKGEDEETSRVVVMLIGPRTSLCPPPRAAAATHLFQTRFFNPRQNPRPNRLVHHNRCPRP